MRRHSWRAISAILLFLAGISHPAGRGQAAEADHLAQALAAMPAGSGAVAFTDWALIKQYTGVPKLTSAAPADQRLRFMRSLDSDQAAFSSYGIEQFAGHATAWSWDSTDLVWEASTQGGSAPPAFVLRFRDDFDFGPLLAIFGKRGFTQSRYLGVPIYSHAMDMSADWLTTTQFAILNTAVLTSRHVLVLSSGLSTVHALLRSVQQAAPSSTGNPAIRAAGAALGTTASAIVFSGSSACSLLDLAKLRQQGTLPAAVRADLGSLKKVHAYGALAVGYRYEGKRPLGLVVMHYADAKAAMADLSARRAVAESGYSLLVQRPYREVLFTLQGAQVTGSDLVLRLRPAHDRPRVLTQMVFATDMTFAACPGAGGAQ